MKQLLSILLILVLISIPAYAAGYPSQSIQTEYVSVDDKDMQRLYINFPAEGYDTALACAEMLIAYMTLPEDSVIARTSTHTSLHAEISSGSVDSYIDVYFADSETVRLELTLPVGQVIPASGITASDSETVRPELTLPVGQVIPASGITATEAAAAPVCPSPQWFMETDKQIINATIDLASSPDFLKALSIPEEVYFNIISSTEYAAGENAEDTYVAIYAPQDMSLLTNDILDIEYDTDSNQFFPQIMNMMLYSMMSDVEIAATSTVKLTDFMPCANIVPTAFIYMSGDGNEGTALMLIHSTNDNIMSVTSQIIPYSIAKQLTDPSSDLFFALSYAGFIIMQEGDEFTQFDASLMTAPAITPVTADDEWLADTALYMAGKLAEQARNKEYLSMYTDDPEVINICDNIGRFIPQMCTVTSIEYFGIDMLTELIPEISGFLLASGYKDTIMYYYAPQIGKLITQANINLYGVKYIVAGTVCTVSEAFFAEADFISCNVTVNCGNGYNVIVSFANYGNGIIHVTAQPIPAE